MATELAAILGSTMIQSLLEPSLTCLRLGSGCSISVSYWVMRLQYSLMVHLHYSYYTIRMSYLMVQNLAPIVIAMATAAFYTPRTPTHRHQMPILLMRYQTLMPLQAIHLVAVWFPLETETRKLSFRQFGCDA